MPNGTSERSALIEHCGVGGSVRKGTLYPILLPEAAASVGINAAILAVPVQLSAGIARTMCPIAGVIIAVSGIAGLSPFELVRRTAPVMILALIMNVAASAIFL